MHIEPLPAVTVFSDGREAYETHYIDYMIVNDANGVSASGDEIM